MERSEFLKGIKKAIMAGEGEQVIDDLNRAIKQEEAAEQRQEVTDVVPCAEELVDFGETGKSITISGSEVYVTINFFGKEEGSPRGSEEKV